MTAPLNTRETLAWARESRLWLSLCDSARDLYADEHGDIPALVMAAQDAYGDDAQQWPCEVSEPLEAMGVCLHCQRAPCAGGVEGEFGVVLCGGEEMEAAE